MGHTLVMGRHDLRLDRPAAARARRRSWSPATPAGPGRRACWWRTSLEEALALAADLPRRPDDRRRRRGLRRRACPSPTHQVLTEVRPRRPRRRLLPATSTAREWDEIRREHRRRLRVGVAASGWTRPREPHLVEDPVLGRAALRAGARGHPRAGRRPATLEPGFRLPPVRALADVPRPRGQHRRPRLQGARGARRRRDPRPRRHLRRRHRGVLGGPRRRVRRTLSTTSDARAERRRGRRRPYAARWGVRRRPHRLVAAVALVRDGHARPCTSELSRARARMRVRRASASWCWPCDAANPLIAGELRGGRARDRSSAPV